MDCGTAFLLETSHWPVDRGPTGQLSHWSSAVSRDWTFALEMYSFRGSFDECMVGAEKIPTEQGTSQSHDEEHVAVELVVDLHRVAYSAKHLDVVSIYCEDLVWHVSRLVDAASLLLVKHVEGDA